MMPLTHIALGMALASRRALEGVLAMPPASFGLWRGLREAVGGPDAAVWDFFARHYGLVPEPGQSLMDAVLARVRQDNEQKVSEERAALLAQLERVGK